MRKVGCLNRGFLSFFFGKSFLLLFSLLYCHVLSFVRELYLVYRQNKWREEMVTVASFWCTSISISSTFFPPFFSRIVNSLFFLQVGFSNARHHGKGMAAPMLEFSEGFVWSTFFMLFTDFDSISDVIRPSCSISFAWHNPFFARPFLLWSLFWQWFNLVDIGVIDPLCGYKFNPAASVSYALFSFTKIILHRFLSVSVSGSILNYPRIA